MSESIASALTAFAALHDANVSWDKAIPDGLFDQVFTIDFQNALTGPQPVAFAGTLHDVFQSNNRTYASFFWPASASNELIDMGISIVFLVEIGNDQRTEISTQRDSLIALKDTYLVVAKIEEVRGFRIAIVTETERSVDDHQLYNAWVKFDEFERAPAQASGICLALSRMSNAQP